MALDITLLAAGLALGLGFQRAGPTDRMRRRLWLLFFWTVSPALVFYAFSVVPMHRELGVALAAAILASWLTILAGFGYARLASGERDERGALMLGASFPNTGFLGYPLAQIALGPAGLAMMVIYDRLAWLVPGNAISTAIARLHGRSESLDARRRLRAAFANPPLFAALVAVALRGLGVDATAVAAPLGDAAGAAIGPVGLFLLGLNLPLEPVVHARAEIRRAAGALAIRFAAAPLILLACGAALRAEIPAAFYLGAAMPCAFHLMILARVFDVRPQLMRLLVVGSTVPAVVAIVSVSAIVR